MSALPTQPGNIILPIQVAGQPHLIPGPALTLEPYSFVARPVRKQLDILLPQCEAIPFFGRATDLEVLRQWLLSVEPFSIQTVTAGGGGGKTRLALELLKSLGGLPATQGLGWQGGFLRQDELREALRLAVSVGVEWGRPTLLIVDYAASAVEALEWLIRGLARRVRQDPSRILPPLRLLLLERYADTGFGWFQALNRKSRAEPVEHFFCRVMELGPVGTLADRWRIFNETVSAFAQFHNKEPVAVPSAGSSWDHLLSGEKWSSPLVLMMAAATMSVARFDEGASTGDSPHDGVVRNASFSDTPDPSLQLSRVELANRVAEWEISRVGRFASSRSEKSLLLHLTAFSTMCGGIADGQLIEIAARELDALNLSYAGGVGELVGRLLDVIPAHSANRPGLGIVEPDLVGEAFVLRVLQKPFQDGIATALRSTWQGPKAASFLIQCLADFAEATDWLKNSDSSVKLDLLDLLESKLPSETTELREAAATINAAQLQLRQVRLDSTEDQAVEVARLANNLSVRLSDLGRREEALSSAQEAVTLLRQLAATRPDLFQPDLAISLNNLAIRLSDLGRREEALIAAQEAVKLYGQLVATRPDAFLPDLAMSLNNLANMLSALGRGEQALSAAQEAVTLYRQLAATRPDAFLPNLAGSLNNLANILSDLGRREEALSSAQEAVTLRRQLAATRPDAFLPDLAMSLNNLANRLSDLGRREEALITAQEAVTLLRQLAATRPDAFLPDLAMSLNNLANTLRALGRREQALSAAQEAVTLRRQFATARPDAFLPDLATSLSVLGDCQAALDDFPVAAASHHESLTILAPFLERYPASFARLAQAITRDYLACLEQANQQPDTALLLRINAVLNSAVLNSGEPHDPD